MYKSTTTKKAVKSSRGRGDDDGEDFVSKETLNRRQDRKLMEGITSTLYRLELDSVKPSFDVMMRTGLHRGLHQQQFRRHRRQQTQDGADKKETRSKKWEKVIDDYGIGGARGDGTAQKTSEKLGSLYAAAAASSAAVSATLPRSWRHSPERETAGRSSSSSGLRIVNGEVDSPGSASKLVRSCLIRVEDVPDRTSSSSYLGAIQLGLARSSLLDDEISAALPSAGSSTTASTYVPRSKTSGGPRLSSGLLDHDLMWYLEKEPGSVDDSNFRQEVIKTGRREPATVVYDPDEDYLEQLLGVSFSSGSGGGGRKPQRRTMVINSSNFGRSSDDDYRSERLPYSPPTIVTGPVSRYNF